MPYLDHTEDGDAPRKPERCPICSGEIVLRWFGIVCKRSGKAVPVFLCKTCQLAVRLFKVPDKPLRTTRAQARKDGDGIYQKRVRWLKHRRGHYPR